MQKYAVPPGEAQVEDMSLRLATSERLWRPYWHENMYWYGPGGLGSYIARDAFQVPFEEMMRLATPASSATATNGLAWLLAARASRELRH